MTQKESNKLKKFCEKLNVKFNDLELLKIALTHRSYLNEQKTMHLQHNERLEFLGDAVIELLVSKYLYHKYTNKSEGELTSFRAATVRTESLAEEAANLDYGRYIFMSKGEEQTGGRERKYILANTFESVLGAIYLDRGIQVAQKFLHRVLFYKIANIVDNRLDIDNKSKLQELAQEVLKDTPLYEIVSSKGPDHAKRFTSKVVIKSKPFGLGVGRSKQTAEQNAAKEALKNWKRLIAKFFKLD